MTPVQGFDGKAPVGPQEETVSFGETSRVYLPWGGLPQPGKCVGKLSLVSCVLHCMVTSAWAEALPWGPWTKFRGPRMWMEKNY